MSIYLVIPALVIVALIQATWMPHLALYGVFPNLPLLVVTSCGLVKGVWSGALWGFIVGVAIDFLSGAPFGAATIALVVIGFLAGKAKLGAIRAQLALPMITVLVATLIYEVIFLSIVTISGEHAVWWESLVRIILPAAALNALLTPPVLWTMRWLDRRFTEKEMEW